ncbi:MAG: acyltransferase domain-containing protein, partial [Synechococcaceae cyanobacterium RL_1_2]|nr:acyltransferase domain-containing protein [Synechococcaceae cyanobacterium RL_1_2]
MNLSTSSDLLPNLLTFSGQDAQALQGLAKNYLLFLEKIDSIDLSRWPSLPGLRGEDSCRLAIAAASMADLRDQLTLFSTQGESGDFRDFIYRESPPAKLKIAFLFTGQGSQYVDMGRELFETHPVFRDAINRCAEILEAYLDYPLLSFLCSSEATSPEDGAAILNQTQYTQPALFAIEYALTKLWQSWGIEPEIVMGHSIGEFVAACVAGVFSLEDALKLVANRGKLMQALPQGGAMAVVMASAEEIKPLLAPYGSDIAIAAINTPQNVLISGKKEVVNEVGKTLAGKEIKVTPLSVSHAFHSPLMEPMLTEFL